MTRPNVSPWFAVGDRVCASQRRPYAELEVWPCASGWSWRVDRIAAQSGAFAAVAEGIEPTQAAAKRAAVDSAAALR